MEKSNLPHAVATDAASGQVRDTTRLEPKPRIRDVNAVAQDWHADRFDRHWVGVEDADDDVEVMNHHVEHNVNV